METYCSDSVPKGSHQELTFLSGFSSNYVPGVFVFFVQINRAERNSHPLQVTSCIDDINFMTLIDDIKFIISIMHLFFSFLSHKDQNACYCSISNVSKTQLFLWYLINHN